MNLNDEESPDAVLSYAKDSSPSAQNDTPPCHCEAR